ncbi:MAG: hypothetical protein HFG81_03235 [Dorea sp.]|uniref:hypothetical protein n=1 Tax=Sporofaciens musculi TaxID=2681861 RepID=UPI00216D59B5|nr:hypothetical protein [Dorea sp.]
MHVYFFGFFMMAFQFAGVVPLTLLLPRLKGLRVTGVFLAEPISNFIGGLACYLTMHATILKPLKTIPEKGNK